MTPDDSERETRLEPDSLRVRVSPELFEHETTADCPPLEGFPTQPRAHGAVAFGTGIRDDGFNIFIMGAAGTGRRDLLRRVMQAGAEALGPPDDWVYVNNFDEPYKPRALCLPSGTAVPLRQAMAELIEDLAVSLPAAFESEEYKSQREALEAEHQSSHEERLADLRDRAAEQGIALLRTPVGFAFAPMEDGQVVKPQAFQSWPEERRKALESRIEGFRDELSEIVQRDLPRMEKELRSEARALDRETARGTISLEIAEVRARFEAVEPVRTYLAAVEEDLVENFHLFRQLAEAGETVPLARKLEHPALRRYAVNVIVGSEAPPEEDGAAARIVEEADPNHANLIGRIEYQPQQGALVTDFTMIKPGALHRANGGFLILEARALLLQPFAWEALKRCLRTGQIRIAPLADRLGLVSTISLEPDEIPLAVKVALIGERMLCYMLAALDPEFERLFKVQADVDDEIDRSDESLRLMGRAVAQIAHRDGLAPFDRTGVAAVLEEASRLSDDAAKLTLRIEALSDLMREAAHWAGQAGAGTVAATHVARAVAERRTRTGRLSERAVEMVARGLVTVETSGSAVGQVNGLSVIALGETRFGRPARITARTRMGTGRIVDIEREVKLGGPIHSKGVLILSSFLASRYGGAAPVSLSASLVFEQSYGGIDGDSASAAELFALVSALSGLGLAQRFAVTGSVDQFGGIQPIGGVNEKIEGFFDVCAGRGLTGEQGVLIPRSNVQHLNLREDVVEAVREGRFSVHAIGHVDEGLALLTGHPAGEADADGAFPPDSVNGRAAGTLAGYAEAMRRFGVRRAGPAGTDGERGEEAP